MRIVCHGIADNKPISFELNKIEFDFSGSTPPDKPKISVFLASSILAEQFGLSVQDVIHAVLNTYNKLKEER